MSTSVFLSQLTTAAGVQTSVDDPQSESLIGIFQSFRPDGLPDEVDVSEIPGGEEFRERLSAVYASVSTSRRSDSMQDAYFIVRNPPMLESEAAKRLGQEFVEGLSEICNRLKVGGDSEILKAPPSVRILEGKAPKHPRSREEHCELLRLLNETIPESIDGLFVEGTLGARLSEALYFIACDRLLRDYLRWPLLKSQSDAVQGATDALAPYFNLWRHGIKYRVFNNDQIDLYLPRRASGTLLDVGQFAMEKLDEQSD